MILKSPLNYSGSKDKIITQLIKYFPKKEDVNTFYDVFAGGLSVTINTDYNKYISNDIINPLIEFYEILQTASITDKIDSEIEKIVSFKINKESQEEFLRVRERFNESYDPYLFFSLVSSCTNNLMRFNQKFKFNQTFGKRTINDNTIQKLKEYCNVLKNKNIQFTNHHFSNLFQIHPPKQGDFIYLDPPYYHITSAGYNAFWKKQDEEYLHQILDSLDSNGIRFALSGVSKHKGKDNPYMNRINKYKVIKIEHDYEKVAKKKDLGETQEILVINY